MVLKYRVVLSWVVCLLFKVILIRCEVTLINRNVTDSFRIGEDGCTKNTVCPTSAACQFDSGLCLCNDSLPNYINYTTMSDAFHRCVTGKSIRGGAGECILLILTSQPSISMLLFNK